MAESLLVKTSLSTDGRYYATGADGPFARIFDVNSNSVVAHVDLLDIVHRGRMSALPNVLGHNHSTHDKQAAVASLRSVKLTAVRVSSAPPLSKSSRDHSHICVCGFTNGTVVGLRIEDNQVLYHSAASDLQHTVVGISIPEDGANGAKYVVVLLSDATIAILDLHTGARMVDRIPVPAGTQGLFAAFKPGTPDALDILLCGTSSVKCSIHVPSHTSGVRMDLVSTFGGSGGAAAIISEQASTLSRAAVYCWIGGSTANDTAVTCAATEGTIRVWSLAAKGGRCVRVLPCNGRVVALSVDGAGSIAATTITGAILLWRFPGGLVGPSAETAPRPPHLCLTSTVKTTSRGKKNRGISYVQTNKVLQCVLCTPQPGAATVATIVRGKFAVPRFDGTPVPPLFTKGLADAAPALSAGTDVAPDRTLYLRGTQDFGAQSAADESLPANVTSNPLETGYTGGSSDEDEEERPVAGWAALKADAHRSYTAAMGEFAAPNIYHAASIKALPTGDSKEARQFVKAMQAGDELPSHNEGIAVVPLYQALHANDRSLVLEIITAVSRAEKDMVAVIRALELPYALQLLHILSERLVGMQRIDHPFHLWVKCLLVERGAEMLAVEASGTSEAGSLPSVFVAPLLASYQSMLSLRERLAVCWGRLSSINAVRPRAPRARKAHATVLRGTIGTDQTAFPLLFKENAVHHNTTVKKAPLSSALVTANNTSYKITKVKRKAAIGRESTAERRERMQAAKKQRSAKKSTDAELDDDMDGDMMGLMGEGSDEDGDDLDQFDDMDLGSSGGDDDNASEADDAMLAEDSDAGSVSAHSSAGDADNLLDSEEDLGLEEEGEEEEEDDEEEEEESLEGSDEGYMEEGLEFEEDDEEDEDSEGALRAD
jgi:hypothetical protein